MEAGAPDITIKYVGGDADDHEIDARLFGQSVIGFERIISDGIIYLTESRLPKKRERAALSLRVRGPRSGSVDLGMFIGIAPGILPLAIPLIKYKDAQVIWEWVSFVLKFLGGNSEADKHIEAMITLQEMHAAERAASEDRWIGHVQHSQDQLFSLVNKLASPGAQAVAPVGPSVHQVNFATGTRAPMQIDADMADTIRARSNPQFGHPENMTLQVDGFSHHGKTLKIERPEAPGKFMNAMVQDPAFGSAPNIYTQAAEQKAAINALVKVARRDDEILQIAILHASSA